ncbi:4-hydroxy-tetrahydrodipicolinate synthase [Caldibacillus thermoamylovorans]|uniref:4-hydroxy-tetrahydrodipicolinate synthase n=1 Tax=Bacillaceae TaxID=186817 RepID=UPI001D07385A|nr:4-hydroxy-tetrahydrodipicolinate synthase [Caldibacillus thermoamylovorans]MCB5934187.1 4-hydroxy-tetrahydrodipicolinate synthase [Bacillus sp. DFI.2.34]MCB7075712.1 4-hydroxy-tetrahydrodipicolinate synthase [Caldibacillus thermoamylovorans]
MKIKGIITAMVTPFDEAQNLNLVATCQLVDKLIESGVDGLFILGTNGEFHLLSNEEKILFSKTVIDHVNHRIPVYVGVGACGTKETIKLAQQMEKVGADALSVITPYLIAPTQEELIQHYKMIAESVNTPIILYNLPKNTGVNIEPSTVATLLEVKNIVAIKDSSGNMENMQGYIDVVKDHDFAVLVGSDSKILSALKMGASGAVAGTSNVITEVIISIYHKFINGYLDEAEKLQKDVDVLREVLKLGTVPSVMKKAVTLLGVNVGDARLPVKSLSEEDTLKIKEALNFYQLKVIENV